MPGPSSATTSSAVPSPSSRRLTLTVVAAWRSGVVEEVARPGDRAVRDRRPPARRRRRVVSSVTAVPRRDPTGRLQHEVVEVDRLGRRVAHRALGSGQVEEVVHEVLQAHDLVEGAAVRRHEVGSLGMGQVDLELGPHPRQRAAQLVGRVGDQAALLVARTARADRASRSSSGPAARSRRRSRARGPDDRGRPGRWRRPGVRIASTGRIARPTNHQMIAPSTIATSGMAATSVRCSAAVLSSHVVEVDAEVQRPCRRPRSRSAPGRSPSPSSTPPTFRTTSSSAHPAAAAIGSARAPDAGSRRHGHHLAVADELGDGVVVAGRERASAAVGARPA